MPDAPQTPAQAVFAVLGYDGAGDLIEALLDAMDAADGDTDREGTFGEGLSEDDEPDAADGDWSWPESHGKGLVARIEPLAQHEDSEEDDPHVTDDDTEGVDEREPDETDHSFGDTTGADAKHRDRIRRTRCRARYAANWHLGYGRLWSAPRLIGYDLKREPTVPRSIKRLRRRQPVTNVVAFRRGR